MKRVAGARTHTAGEGGCRQEMLSEMDAEERV
jgi:hypothetical protein